LSKLITLHPGGPGVPLSGVGTEGRSMTGGWSVPMGSTGSRCAVCIWIRKENLQPLKSDFGGMWGKNLVTALNSFSWRLQD